MNNKLVNDCFTDIVIVNWNSGQHLKKCIDSVLIYGNRKVSRIIVVDNGSTDGSADIVKNVPSVVVIATGENLGFAAACNIGAAAGEAPYLLFLNPDTQVEANSFAVPLAFMERPENVGVGICGISLVDDDGVITRTCARFPTLGRLAASAFGIDRVPGLRGTGMRMVEWEHDQTQRVDQVMGAFFLIRRNVYKACEGFDERFFVYFEEVDLAHRSRIAGWDSWYLTGVQAFHAGGGTSRQVKVHRLFYSLRSRLLYAFKHFPRWQAWILVVVTNVLEPFTRFAWCLIRGDFIGVKHTWAAYRMLWRSMGHILRGEGRYNP